jgi:hypothetical protein
MTRDSKEHILARADYYAGLVTKTTDPVRWSVEKVLEALEALKLAHQIQPRRYANSFAMAEHALAKVT